MGKKVKLVAVIETEENTLLDDAAIERSVGILGVVKSYEVSLDTGDSGDKITEKVTQAPASSSEIKSFINNSNKIYFGNLTPEERISVGITILHASNLEKIKKDSNFKNNLMQMFINKFSENESYLNKLVTDTNDDSLFGILKSKFLEGDLTQMFIFLWQTCLSKGDEDDFEVELIESTAEKFSFEKPEIGETKKQGNERAKVSKAIDSINSGAVAYNKLKAFEKSVLVGLLLTECSKIDGKISQDDLKILKNLLNAQFGITSNASVVLVERDLGYSLTKKVEQVEVYREKYELVEFLWERILSTEENIKDDEMELIRKMVRRLDISDVESEGARKEVEQNLYPDGEKEE